MKIDTYQFFMLPLEEKKAYSQLPNNIEGYGQAFVVSEEQKLDWGDMLFFMSLPVHGRNTRFWPTSPTSYRETLDRYAAELHKVAVSLVGVMAKNLGLEPEKLANMFEIDGSQGLRMNYYPPCPVANKVLGLSPHSDATGLTLLLQVNEVQGLQIRKNGIWVPIKPIAGALIVNIGDVIEIMTNGKYKSIEHRAVVNSEKERLSIAAFHGPSYGTRIGPLPDLLKDNQEKYKTLSHDEYLRQVITTKLDGKSLLDDMKVHL
ncbi:2-oxoglutarate (2OG) and Fe(II)-dependent oxygenase superfamily protein [Thalictrum thalictroides]|uniref:2-oxoglutarate (2OG) and Fe(II)-dependent oxygenase superfamily protein n=1 Tax=Thalictrum thalictroides TaxID=46969 RepID=A0A7J6V7Q4_THATH|nr:2-oxoglutarate (2OG) and Fe(II)-dependent oxygenase superfamily protein [Thalictrum thalictroides]